jgi:hypothetical protein
MPVRKDESRRRDFGLICAYYSACLSSRKNCPGPGNFLRRLSFFEAAVKNQRSEGILFVQPRLDCPLDAKYLNRSFKTSIKFCIDLKV